MPTLAQGSGWKITMYPADHNPPHFHIRTRSGEEAQIRLGDMAVMAGSVPARVLDEALTWARANGLALRRKWTELNKVRE